MPQHARTGEQLVLSPWRWLLLPAWLCFRPLVMMRNWFFDRGWRQQRELPVPVIGIGNIAVGGTGKTPLVAWLAEQLLAAGYQPQVLSRGYQADASGRNEEADLVPVPVVCNPSRYEGGQEAIAAGADCCLLDDAYQHRQLHRDCNIVTIDATRPWGRPWRSDGSLPSGQTLPLGLLREGPTALQRADLVLLTRSELVNEQQVAIVKKAVQRYTKADVLCCAHQLAPAQRIIDGTQIEHPDRVVLVSGIGNPAAFERAVTLQGYQVVAHHAFADHYHFDAQDVAMLNDAAAAAKAHIICTEKDAIKLCRIAGTDGWAMVPLRCSFTAADQELPWLPWQNHCQSWRRRLFALQ